MAKKSIDPEFNTRDFQEHVESALCLANFDPDVALDQEWKDANMFGEIHSWRKIEDEG